MRQGWAQAGAWLLATGAAVTLSWFGVHTVISGTAYDAPLATPIAHAATPEGSSPDGDEPTASSTRDPAGTPSPSRTPPESPEGSSSPSPADPVAPADGGRESPPPAGDEEGGPSGEPPAAQSGNVRGYTVAGGRVAFELGADSASLVSATPEAGWQVRVWKQEQWIRVTFTSGERASSVFCTWHDGPPRVQLDER
ncbi:hypothetical protein JJV70_13640 [Streptomyces sp. JJ66]|uniref:hypothetical protein n=1 Tax=Streptomyces sp. JJ66 TaxID=2803843 RepID=UPI001C564618|nr:hypothetical protein [Streptomyces sp. JJ66]MBW1603129.1 hypothetical protein [Streptomyces sp. JJ66]